MTDECLSNVDCLGVLFRFLSNEDLVRCSQVNDLWREISLKIITRRLKNYLHIKIYNCNNVELLLKKTQIVSLDLTEMVLPENMHLPRSNYRTDYDFWNDFILHVGNLKHLRNIKLHSCPVFVIVSLRETNRLLQKFEVVNLKGYGLHLSHLTNFRDLIELHLKFDYQKLFAFDNDDGYQPGVRLQNLQHLTITGVSSLSISNVLGVTSFEHLRSLSLGGCLEYLDQFREDALKHLKQLEKLRLEKYKGPGILTVLNFVGKMEKVRHLEILDIDVLDGIEEAIASCGNLKKFLIAPNPKSINPEKNRRILCGVAKLRNNLRNFSWVFSRKLFSASSSDIVILNELPVLDLHDNVVIPPPGDMENVTIFETDMLSEFITRLLPNCTVEILRTSYFKGIFQVGYPF